MALPSRLLAVLAGLAFNAALASEARPPCDDADLGAWLENMIRHHRYTVDEAAGVLGMKPEQVRAAIARFDITPERRPKRAADAPVRVLPYPGGRHPRIGFLDGA